jgi:cytochrome c-type biogenesis protein CcmE
LSKRRIWSLIAAVLLLGGLGYGALSLFIHSESDNITVSEAKSQARSLSGQRVRVGGRVEPGSIDWDAETQVMRFTLTDSRSSLDVVYRGVVPDHFKPGAELVVEGRYTPSGELEALSFPTRSVCSLCH